MAPPSSDVSTEPLVIAGQSEEDICEVPSQSRALIPRGVASVAVVFFGGVAIGTIGGKSFTGGQVNTVADVGTHLLGLAAKALAEHQSDCSAPGAACLDSGCCVPGGQKGLQCFKKNDNYAECSESCEPGVHEGEEEGEWDTNGVFQKAQWSCEKLGTASKPGCESFVEAESCPSEYCVVKGEDCRPKCGTYANPDACWKGTDCMWEDDTCMDACWGFGTQETCAPTKYCKWLGKKGCQMGPWLFKSHDECPHDLGYMWNGSCVQDPCSMQGEDCSQTKCCSVERGGSGQTCFKKDQYWATCQESCEKHGNWSCEALGPRAKFDAGCGWAGEDCSLSKLCCNRGFVCAVKNSDFTGCVLTESTSTWEAQSVPMPADWEGTVVGGGRDEFEVPQAGLDEPKIGTTLYCFMAYLPDSYEEALIALAKKNKASIYGCEKADLYHTWQSGSGGWDTGETTLMNTDVFVKVWEQVQERGDFIHYDWTVKVDPDCVFAPERLRSHIQSYNLASWAAAYIKNNGQDPGLGNNGFLGAIEIFSKRAMLIYMDNAAGCLKALGTQAGEDGFMKGCMDGIGVGFKFDVDIFFPDNGAGACMNEARVAFHPLKDPEKWQHCWDILTGKVPF